MKRNNTETHVAFVKGMREFVVLVFAICLMTMAAFSQASDPQDPKRGMQPGGSYSISDIENINLANGNLSLNMPLISLPKGRGPGGWSGYVYNSKLYKPITQEVIVGIETTDQNLLAQSDEGGWRATGSLSYQLKLTDRFEGIELIECNSGTTVDIYKNAYRWKFQVTMPDGADIEFRPTGYTDHYGDGYFSFSPDGYNRSVSPYPTCDGAVGQVTTSPITYYSADGSRLRLVVDPTDSSFVLYFPDGSYFESDIGRMTDRYGDYVQATFFTYGGKPAGGLVDNSGRKIFGTAGDEPNEKFYYQLGVNGAALKWTVRTKDIYVRRQYQTTAHAGTLRGGTSTQVIAATINVLDEIVLPEQLGGQSYVFTYTGSDTEPGPTEYSDGWGEIESIRLPSGALAEYSFTHGWENTDKVLEGHVSSKSLTYNAEYDGSSTEVTDSWGYTFNSGDDLTTVTSPDGSQMTQKRIDTGSPNPLNGSVKTIENSNGTKVERIWATNATPWGGGNPFAKMEFTSIKNAAGSYVQTAIKEFAQDKNGNTTLVKEYGFVPYGDVPRTNSFPTGLPSGSCSSKLCPVRTTTTTYNNSTPDSTDTSNAAYGYWNFGAIKGVAATSEIKNGSNAVVSKTEFTYDNVSTTANLTRTRVWDSEKSGTITSPLTDGNSIKTEATYNDYGMPETKTDARGYQTTITYGNITCPSGTVNDLYPTQTVVADGTAIERTSSATYDCYTGLTTSTTDEDNDVTNAMVYDDLGRPVKAITAQGETGFESWTQTIYDDAARRVIVKSDLETVGDDKKVAIQHYDQLGRVRLSRTLEDSASQDPTDEEDGIKVQTRYKVASGYTYQLTSNPYRADVSSEETDATMGWTLSTAWSSGIRSEVQTFTGAGLPVAFGGENDNSTGIVRTDIDANAKTITDQSGKKRKGVSNALGQMVEVIEDPAGQNLSTTYLFDTLGNLRKTTQGDQNRYFMYSSLGRLLFAKQPEQDTNSNLTATDPVTSNTAWSVKYLYDNNGNITSTTDALNKTVTATYDELGRITLRDYSDTSMPDVTFTYDEEEHAFGKLNKVSTSISETRYTGFDLLGRVSNHEQYTNGETYATEYKYNLSGALVEETYPSGRVVQHTFDQGGRFSQVKSKKNSNHGFFTYANSPSYNASGAIAKLQLGNGRWETASYNSRMQTTQIGLGVTSNTQNLLKLEFNHGSSTQNNGNLLEQKITVPDVGETNGFLAIQSYTYDGLNRLQSATEEIDETETWKQTFSYDRFGNRRFNTESNNTTTLPESFDPDVFNPTISTSHNRFSGGQGYSYS